MYLYTGSHFIRVMISSILCTYPGHFSVIVPAWIWCLPAISWSNSMIPCQLGNSKHKYIRKIKKTRHKILRWAILHQQHCRKKCFILATASIIIATTLIDTLWIITIITSHLTVWRIRQAEAQDSNCSFLSEVGSDESALMRWVTSMSDMDLSEPPATQKTHRKPWFLTLRNLVDHTLCLSEPAFSSTEQQIWNVIPYSESQYLAKIMYDNIYIIQIPYRYITRKLSCLWWFICISNATIEKGHNMPALSVGFSLRWVDVSRAVPVKADEASRLQDWESIRSGSRPLVSFVMIKIEAVTVILYIKVKFDSIWVISGNFEYNCV